MALPNQPVLKKFFANKIESSRESWGDYLLEVADIFSTFDGEDYDVEQIKERFSAISGRSPYALRDIANFRDEFGAYGTYLGVFRIERVGGSWKIYLSDAARHFLCSTEPDVESFCRTQMALFQYPNGAGAAYNTNGSIRFQSNVKADTQNEVQNNIRINPLRILCKCVVGLHELGGVDLAEIKVPFASIFLLVNDNSINATYTPETSAVYAALDSYETITPPTWATDHRLLTNFKRNFHIFERTGLFSRYNHEGEGLKISSVNRDKAYLHIKAIAQMTSYFDGFEDCYDQIDISSSVSGVISDNEWGKYFDAFRMPMQMLATLSDELDVSEIALNAPPIGAIAPIEQPFPEFREFQSNAPRAFIASGNITDPYETIIRREKANREHARILSLLASVLRLQGYAVSENTFVDLFTTADGLPFIFEVKSNNSRNTLSQIRKAIAQLYEYRYRSASSDAILCIVLQQKPSQEWVIDYLLNDRNILLCWLVDDVRLECPEDCKQVLENIGLVN